MDPELLEPLALFLAPFAIYALTARYFGDVLAPGSRWSRSHITWLVAAGLISAILGTLAMTLILPARQGTYAPARIINGHLTGGRFAP